MTHVDLIHRWCRWCVEQSVVLHFVDRLRGQVLLAIIPVDPTLLKLLERVASDGRGHRCQVPAEVVGAVGLRVSSHIPVELTRQRRCLREQHVQVN